MSKPKGVISQSGQRVVELLSHPEMVLPNGSECMQWISGDDLMYVVANAGAAQSIWRTHVNICGATLRDWF